MQCVNRFNKKMQIHKTLHQMTTILYIEKDVWKHMLLEISWDIMRQHEISWCITRYPDVSWDWYIYIYIMRYHHINQPMAFKSRFFDLRQLESRGLCSSRFCRCTWQIRSPLGVMGYSINSYPEHMGEIWYWYMILIWDITIPIMD